MDSTVLDDAVTRQNSVTQLVAQVRRVGREVPDAKNLTGVHCTRLASLTGRGYDRPGKPRIARKTAPDRVVSTVDSDTRHAHKTRERRQDGLKAHVVAEPGTGLTTACELTKTNGPENSDATVGSTLVVADPTIGKADIEVLVEVLW